jgi:AcrR family transcriptional regulator
MPDKRPSGRRAQAAANDEAILRAAREVFVADPSAPIAEVAERAGVGIGALYRRYTSKDALIGTLCAIGQQVYLEEVELALAEEGDPWEVWVGWLRRIVEADTHALVVRLAGTFTPTAEHLDRADQMLLLGTRLFERTAAAGVLRAGLTFVDVGLLLELVATTQLGDANRMAEMRRRYLEVIVAGMYSQAGARLPGDPPTWEEQAARWVVEPAPTAGD